MSNDYTWWKHGIIYQIYPRSFADSNADGVGDLRGLIDRLDYLRGGEHSLNVDAIWLSPIFPSPMADFGYDVADYCDIDPLFGTMADFDELLAKAHERGLKIVLDMVFNHSSDQHPWFVESRSSRDNPKRDWYIWRDPAEDGGPPNNWQAFFGGAAWTLDETTAQYYMHSFLSEQPELNWRNPETRAAIMDVMRFWLDKGVDGFRLDVFNLYFKDAEFRDNPGRFGGLRAFDRQQHIYNRDQPELHDALREMRALVDSYPGDRMMLGETVGDDPLLVGQYLGDADKADKLHMAFNFAFTHQNWRARGFLDVVTAWEAAMPPDGWPVYTLSNHDVDRHATRFGGGPSGDERAKVAAAMLLTVRGTPVMYYGEEIGMRNGKLRRDQIVDPPGKRFWPLYQGRDPERTPMQWDASRYAGFGEAVPWLPVNKDYVERNVERQLLDPHSVWNFYSDLIDLRSTTPALQLGALRPLIARPVEVLAFARVLDDAQVVVLLNFYGWPVTVSFDEPLAHEQWQVLLNSHDRSAAVRCQSKISLSPYEVLILKPAR